MNQPYSAGGFQAPQQQQYGQPAYPQPGYQSNGSPAQNAMYGGASYPPPPSAPANQEYYSAKPDAYQMQTPQSYAPQAPVPQNGGKMYDGGRTSEVLTTKPKWNDLFFAILFLAQFLGFIAVAVIALRALSLRNVGDTLGSGGNSVTLDQSTAYVFAFISALGLLLAVLFLGFVRMFTKICIEVTLALSVLVSVGYAIYLWIEGYTSGAIVYTIFAVLAVVSYFFMRKRIRGSVVAATAPNDICSAFSVAILQAVMDVAKHYKSTYIIALLGCIVQTIYAVFWSFVLAA
jgi:hypothetical protein